MMASDDSLFHTIKSSANSEEDVWYMEVLHLVREAGVIVKEAFGTRARIDTDTKSSNVDLVTKADKAVEDLLVKGLSARFPDHRFIGEESTTGKCLLTEAPTWIIDPIDGTTNFVHKIPFVAIEIGLYVNKKPRIGIVYNPLQDELYSARKGQGAFLNGFPLSVSGCTDMDKSVIVSTIGSFRPDGLVTAYLETTRRIVDSTVRGLRSFGAAAINMVYVARGCCDAYIEIGIHCWDMAGAALIIQEAGGVVMDPSGGEFDIMSRRLLCASSKELALKISKLLVDVPAERDD